MPRHIALVLTITGILTLAGVPQGCTNAQKTNAYANCSPAEIEQLIGEWEKLCGNKAIHLLDDPEGFVRQLAEIRRGLSDRSVLDQVSKADEYARQNPDDFREIMDRYVDILGAVDDEPLWYDPIAHDAAVANLGPYIKHLSGRWTSEGIEADVRRKRDDCMHRQEKAGEEAYTKLKGEVEVLLQKREFAAAQAKVEQFPGKFGEKWRQKVLSLVPRVVDLADTKTMTLWKQFQTPGANATWECRSGTLVGRMEVENEKGADSMLLFSPSGDERWSDFEVTFAFKLITKGFGVIIIKMDPEQDTHYVNCMVTCPDKSLKTGEWYNATFSVTGDMATLTVGGWVTESPLTSRTASSTNCFGFILNEPGAEVQIKPGEVVVHK